MSTTHRVLVLLTESSAAEYAKHLQARYRVVSQMPPRILVLDVGEDALGSLSRVPEVSGLYEQDLPSEIRAQLRPEERLFVDGWAAQRAQRDKKRLGDGLSWDTAGFQPPDSGPKKRL